MLHVNYKDTRYYLTSYLNSSVQVPMKSPGRNLNLKTIYTGYLCTRTRYSLDSLFFPSTRLLFLARSPCPNIQLMGHRHRLTMVANLFYIQYIHFPISWLRRVFVQRLISLHSEKPLFIRFFYLVAPLINYLSYRSILLSILSTWLKFVYVSSLNRRVIDECFTNRTDSPFRYCTLLPRCSII